MIHEILAATVSTPNIGTPVVISFLIGIIVGFVIRGKVG
jgi:hypothetical protein